MGWFRRRAVVCFGTLELWKLRRTSEIGDTENGRIWETENEEIWDRVTATELECLWDH